MQARLPARIALALFVTGLFAAAPVVAEKPDWAGGQGKPQSNVRDDRREVHRDDRRDGGTDVRVSVHFGDRERRIVHDYYEESFRQGRCPPGLAKKRNGCMPPGQAKKWRRGAPLPRDVVYYDLPPRVAVEIGVPPPGHKFVRVASDILLIAIGTGMVVDAIEDLGRM